MSERLSGGAGEEVSSNNESGWSILEKYAADERRRIDEAKEKLKAEDYDGSVSKNEALLKPKAWRKIGRIALDLVNLHPAWSEERRQREAREKASYELDIEQAQQRFEDDVAYELGATERSLASDVYNIMRAEADERRKREDEERDRESLASKMIDEMDNLRRKKQGIYQNERAQELIERDLNDRLVKIDELDAQAEAGNPEVGKREIEYDGKKIAVYDLKGYPFAMLNHAIDYKSLDDEEGRNLGSQTASYVVEHPDFWAQREDEKDFAAEGGSATGDVISTSYFSSAGNLNSRYYRSLNAPALCYGFLQVDGDSILSIRNGDGETSNRGGKGRTNLTEASLDVWRELETSVPRYGHYNEVLIRRYKENGEPVVPDCIIAQNNEITDAMLRHAQYFNIPILNIDEQEYNKKYEQQANELIDSVNDDMPYLEVASIYRGVGGLQPYRNKTANVRREFLKGDYDMVTEYNYKNANSEIEKKIVELAEVEFAKRLEFIEATLKSETEKIKQATARGERYDGVPDGLESLDVREQGDDRDAMVNVEMLIKDETRPLSTKICKIEGDDMRIYETIEPLAREYMQARKENRGY